MSFESFVGLRFLKPKRKQLVFSVITMITVTGITVGVATLIIVISVLSGLQDTIQTKHLESFSHLIITSYQPFISDYEKLIERVSGFDEVEAVSPFLYGEVMMASETSVGGAIVRGVDSRSVGNVTSLVKNMKIGTVDSIEKMHPEPFTGEKKEDVPETSYPGILLGEELASQLHVVMGSQVRVVSPLGNASPMGMMPKMKRFIVTGIFSAGLYEFDAKFAFMSISEAQSFFNLPEAVTGLEIRLTDFWKARQVGDVIANELGWPYRALAWMDLNRNLFSAMKLEKLVMFIIVSLIIMVAAMNIFSTIYMMVMDKRKSIAILKTMGASNRRITKVFVAPGLYIALLGSFLGFVIGVSICLLQMKFGFVRLDPQVYWFDQLPMKFKLFDFALIAIAAFAFSFVATIIPARLAAKMDPVRVLRYE